MSTVEVQHYLGRARDFFNGMRLLSDDLGTYGSSSALLGIHCAISYCDALRVGMGSESLSAEDHLMAARELKSLLASRRFDRQEGVNRLEKLIAEKGEVAYLPKRVSSHDVERIVQQVQRFAIWAEDAGKRLRGGEMIELEAHKGLGRAKNAIQEYLIRKLLLPKVYFDGEWCGRRVDVLAIDRTGVGDVHVVEIASATPHFVAPERGHELTMVAGTREFDVAMERTRSIPGQFRYLAALVPGSRSKDYYAGSKLLQAALAEDGVGRVGVLFVDLNGEEPTVKVIIKPERFRSAAEIIKLTDEFVSVHTPNWEIRE